MNIIIKKSLVVFCCIFSFQVFSQEVNAISVEKSLFGIQTGLLGIWVNNESKLSKEISLRSEIGLDAGVFGGEINNGTGFILAPVVTLEPRWYYNLEIRNNKGKNIKNNSGNFFTPRISYNPDWFVISNKENISAISQISVIPKWGIKRTYNHLTFETGIGFGYRFYLEKFANKNGDATLDLHLRIGYTF